MLIPQAQETIKHHKLAAANAEELLNLKVNQDEKYKEFSDRYLQSQYTVVFYAHTQSFTFHTWNITRQTVYFVIDDNKITYSGDNSFDGVQAVAEELLEIVKRFY